MLGLMLDLSRAHPRGESHSTSTELSGIKHGREADVINSKCLRSGKRSKYNIILKSKYNIILKSKYNIFTYNIFTWKENYIKKKSSK